MPEHNTTIIVMEDDATLRKLIAGGVSEAGYAVVEASTGGLAQTALEAASGRAILIADRSVDPDGPNGFQLASEALDRFADLRVIYISGTHIAVRRRTLGERERALLKPFAMSQLLSAIRELWG